MQAYALGVVYTKSTIYRTCAVAVSNYVLFLFALAERKKEKNKKMKYRGS